MSSKNKNKLHEIHTEYEILYNSCTHHFKMLSLLQNIRDDMTSLTVDWCLV